MQEKWTKKQMVTVNNDFVLSFFKKKMKTDGKKKFR